MPRLGTLVVAGIAVSLAGCRGGAWTMYEENDDLSLRGQDNIYYTQGIRFSRVLPASEAPAPMRDAAEAMPTYEKQETNAVGLVVGQEMYTPSDTSVAKPLKGDRPYAGWLYGGVLFGKQKIGSPDRADDDQHVIEVDLGVVGEESLAESTQNAFHRLIGTNEAQGWRNQIGFEVGVIGAYERRRRLVDVQMPLGLRGDLLGKYGARLGNVHTDAGGGFTARIGCLPRDFGVNTLSTTAMETTTAASDGWPSMYLFGSVDGRGVGRNIFLDSNTFKDSAHVDKTHVVGEFAAGVAFQWKAFRLTYTWVTRSPEFHGQHGWTKYGSVSLGLFLDF